MTTIESTTTAAPHKLIGIDPHTLLEWQANGNVQLVDVREDFEHAVAHIADSELHALSKFDPDSLRVNQRGRRIVFYCRTGRRSAEAATRFGHCVDGNETTYHLEGGITAWTGAGLATERSHKAPPMDVMRQVQITIGTMVMLFTALGAFISPWFLAATAFFGAGMFWAGASGSCALAAFMAWLPWNRVEGVQTCAVCAD